MEVYLGRAPEHEQAKGIRTIKRQSSNLESDVRAISNQTALDEHCVAQGEGLMDRKLEGQSSLRPTTQKAEHSSRAGFTPFICKDEIAHASSSLGMGVG